MTRKKVKLAYIANDSSRKATFKKRKKGLMKKVNELSTLCGITACAIIYSPYDSSPEVWPSNSGVQRVVSQFRTLPEMDQHKKMVDQETFLKQRIAKAFDNLKRQRKDNRELEMTEVMFQCLVGNMAMFHLNIIDLNDLGYLIEQYLKDINRRIEILQGSNLEIGESSNANDQVVVASSEGIGSMAIVSATTTPPAITREVGSSSSSSRAAPTTFFNLFHQHQQEQHEFRHQAAAQVGLYEQNLSLNLNQGYNQNQQMFMEMMNHPQQMSLPFMDDNRNHHHHQSQQLQISGDSSTSAAAVSTISNTTPTTNPNLNRNIWFR